MIYKVLISIQCSAFTNLFAYISITGMLAMPIDYWEILPDNFFSSLVVLNCIMYMDFAYQAERKFVWRDWYFFLAAQIKASAIYDLQRSRSNLESLFCYDKSVPEENIGKPSGLNLEKKNVGNNPPCSSCEAKGAVLCATCAGSGLYVDSILESQGIIVKVRCLGKLARQAHFLWQFLPAIQLIHDLYLLISKLL